MKLRTTILLLALLIVAAGAAAGPPECCAHERRAEQSMDSMDCCGTAFACPVRAQDILSIAPSTTIPTPSQRPCLAAPVAVSAGSTTVFASAAISSGRPYGSSPPLYQLHAQLLV